MSNDKKYKLVADFIGQDPVEFARKHHYNQDCIQLLKGERISDAEVRTCRYLADNRSFNRYQLEIIYAWIIEDWLIDRFNSIDNVFASHNGSDHKRQFLTKKDITTESDFRLQVYEDDINFDYLHIEVVTDFNEFWSRTGKCHLRDNKLPNLIKKSKSDNVLILAVDVVNQTFGFISINQRMDYKYISSHFAFGGKPACEVRLNTKKFFNKLDIKKSYLHLKGKAS